MRKEKVDKLDVAGRREGDRVAGEVAGGALLACALLRLGAGGGEEEEEEWEASMLRAAMVNGWVGEVRRAAAAAAGA